MSYEQLKIEIENLKKDLTETNAKVEKLIQKCKLEASSQEEPVPPTFIKFTFDKTEPATKIGQFTNKLDVSIGNLSHQFGTENRHGDFCGIKYFNLTTQQALMDMFLPKELHKHFKVYFYYIDYSDVDPHVEGDVKTFINCYMKPSHSITEFYGNDEEVGLVNCFDFQPEKGDIWVIDGKVTHSISNYNKVVGLSFQTSDLTYEEVLTHFANSFCQ